MQIAALNFLYYLSLQILLLRTVTMIEVEKKKKGWMEMAGN